MNDVELNKIWTTLDSRITTINERTKAHTIQIKELEKKIKGIETKKKVNESQELNKDGFWDKFQL